MERFGFESQLMHNFKYVKTTIARKRFKRIFGQSNHFLITILIGLDQISSGSDIVKPDDFRTSWDPKDKNVSAERSRKFLLSAFLAYLVDGIDMYLTSIYRKPKLIKGDEIDNIYSRAGQSVAYKVEHLGEYLKIDPVYICMTSLIIVCRNRTVHYYAENKLSDEQTGILKSNLNRIKDEFCHLDILQLLCKIDKNHVGEDYSLTFKEVASLIKATHLFIEKVDEVIIQKNNLEEYGKEVIEEYLGNNPLAKVKYQDILSTHKEDKDRYLFNILSTYASFTKDDYDRYKNSVSY